MKLSLTAAGALSLALLLGACSSAETTPEPAAPMAPATSTAPASPATDSPSAAATSDIVDTAVAAGSFKTLATALEAAGLVDTLKGPGPFTVFAPTDDAFDKLPAGTVDTLLKEPKGKLAEILKYHVVSGDVRAADVVKMDGQKVKTVQGSDLTVEVKGDKVALIDGAGNRVNVTKTDVVASNGVIHVLDGVLMPPA